jgi:ABC-type proline/glycine betaine transport system permease subunit
MMNGKTEKKPSKMKKFLEKKTTIPVFALLAIFLIKLSKGEKALSLLSIFLIFVNTQK